MDYLGSAVYDLSAVRQLLPGRRSSFQLLNRVLGTSARKPPLSDTLLWVTLSLAHPFEIEVILSKRVEVLPKQRGREAQNIVVDHLAFSAELAGYRS